MPVAGDDEAVALMNDSPYGLTASIWTADLDAAVADRRPGRDRHRATSTAATTSTPRWRGPGSKDSGRGMHAVASTASTP